MARFWLSLIFSVLLLGTGLWITGRGDRDDLPCPFGGCASAQTASDCIVEDQGVCIWPTASDGVRQKRDTLHTGTEGLLMRDGTPAPMHECSSCHDDPDLLPANHIRTAGMSTDGCNMCHGSGRASSLDERLFQSHTHFFADVGCASCHTDPEEPDAPESAVCMSCHGTLEELGARTAHLEETVHANPHASPHGAPYAECTLCHYQHEPAVNYCATCHRFDFKMR